MTSNRQQQVLLDLWQEAISAVSGHQSVRTAINQDSGFLPDCIIAVGKAASGMYLGAKEALEQRYPALGPLAIPAVVVTKYAHADEAIKHLPHVQVIESAHPIPDQQSLRAGQTLLDTVRNLPPEARLLVLVSGGASALAEALPEGLSLEDLQQKTDQMIATGKTIAEINHTRKTMSRIKDGKLLAEFRGAELRVYAISDVEGDDIATLGSGLGDTQRVATPSSCRIVASNRIARLQAAARAEALGYPVLLNEESLYGDVFVLARQIGATLRQYASHAQSGIAIWGGEPTICLPENPGSGGRNQSLALALATEIAGLPNLSVLVAGTDGTDGPTDAAGGLVNGQTVQDHAGAQTALQRADAGTYLRQQGALFACGPTNTNVMDLVIAVM